MAEIDDGVHPDPPVKSPQNPVSLAAASEGQGVAGDDPRRPPSHGLRKLFDGRPHWMNGLMLFCIFMTFFYVPWDIFIKPVEADQEVWFGIMFTGWEAKFAAIPHWAVYGAGAYGFWKMTGWMWPWAAVYTAQIAIGMAVWALLQPGSWIVALVSFIPFAVLTWALWNARPRFGTGSN